MSQPSVVDFATLSDVARTLAGMQQDQDRGNLDLLLAITSVNAFAYGMASVIANPSWSLRLLRACDSVRQHMGVSQMVAAADALIAAYPLPGCDGTHTEDTSGAI